MILASRWYRPLIRSTAERYKFDPIVIEAMVMVESIGRADAFREEPAFWRKYLATNDLYKHMNPRVAAGSYGLMQVMYSTARDMGFPADRDPEDLFVPRRSLEYGCKYLAWIRDEKFRGLPLEACLAAYNGGPTDDNRRAPYRNREYVARVKAQVRIITLDVEKGNA